MKFVQFTSVLSCLMLSSAFTFAGPIVNVNADGTNDIDNPAITINFQPGDTFTLTPLGAADGGAFNAWNSSGFSAGCNEFGNDCTNGWQWDVGVYIDGDTTNIGSFGISGLFETSDLALANIRDALNGAFGAPSFVIPNVPWSSLSFFIQDSPFADNLGGISFMYSIEPGEGSVPLPGALALITLGLAGLRWSLRNRV